MLAQCPGNRLIILTCFRQIAGWITSRSSVLVRIRKTEWHGTIQNDSLLMTITEHFCCQLSDCPKYRGEVAVTRGGSLPP
ncbi:unnamed protein product [Cylicocyclus nassatus]|uniref:Uncharacterized protein n=1 Tax=Cylicocyclus nassatus TaxID=53992 RepID=A0AA36DPZ1_CYLNA|nr:unnamed protein product [Cylicocyclus nassatus]CAJ0602162.1 unnamed protein product [Cylicocyclus nassatus]